MRWGRCDATGADKDGAEHFRRRIGGPIQRPADVFGGFASDFGVEPSNSIMTNDMIFYTQLASIVVFLLTLFAVYRLLVEQKDSMIQLLKERLADKDAKLKELESQTPDALTTALSSRIEITLKEVARLKADGDKHREEFEGKEAELRALRQRLNGLSALIQDSDLVCEKCGAPLNQRSFYPIYGHVEGREIEVEGEYVEYECGRAIRDGEEVSPCKR